MVPSTRQSANHYYHGPITKAGNSHARWMLTQGVQYLATNPGPLGVFYRRLTYGSELITCGHRGAPVTGEAVTKPKTQKVYRYYRCSKYNMAGHPRNRVTETKLDKQVLAIFAKLRQPEVVRTWFGRRLRDLTQYCQKENIEKAAAHQRDLTVLRSQQDQLVNLYTLGEIELESYSKWNTEFRDRIAALTAQLESVDRRRDEHAELAIKVFELSQSLGEKWVTADHAAKRRIMEIICLNFSLVDVSLVPEWRKPFNLLAEGLFVHSYRGDRRWTFPIESIGQMLLMHAVAQSIVFTEVELAAAGGT